MFGYNPTPEGSDAAVDEYFRVRDKLREIFEDYVFLYSMRGVQYHVDVYHDASELDQRAAEALEDAKYLDGLLGRMQTLATTDPPALQDEWPDILEILECYTYHHQFLKGVRPLANVWELGISKEIARALPGRPTTASPIARDPEELWRVGNQVLTRFEGKDPGQIAFAREYLRLRGIRPRFGLEHTNPARSLLRRAERLEVNGGHDGLIKFLRGPEPVG
jgi:hypothetical protein